MKRIYDDKDRISNSKLERLKRMLKHLENGEIEPVKNYFIYLIDHSLKDMATRGTATQFSRELTENKTESELRVEEILSSMGIMFKCQQTIFYNERKKFFIVDYYIPGDKLIIEVDGNHHYTPEYIEKDNARTKILNSKGFTVIRFKNKETFDKELIINKINENISQYQQHN